MSQLAQKITPALPSPHELDHTPLSTESLHGTGLPPDQEAVVRALSTNDRKAAAGAIAALVKAGKLEELGNALDHGFANPHTRESTMKAAVEAVTAELRKVPGAGAEQVRDSIRDLGMKAIETHLAKQYATDMNDPSFYALRGHCEKIAEATGLGKQDLAAAVATRAKDVAADDKLSLAMRHREIHDLGKLFKLDEDKSDPSKQLLEAQGKIDGTLQAEGAAALEKLFAQNGTKPLPFAFTTKVKHLQDQYLLTDEQVKTIAAKEINEAVDSAKGAEHTRLIATKDFANSVRSKFGLGDEVKPAFGTLEAEMSHSAEAHITRELAGPITKKTFGRVDTYAETADLEAHKVKDIAAAEVIKRLQRSSGPGEDLKAAAAIAAEYRLTEREDVRSAVQINKSTFMYAKLSEVANQLIDPKLSTEVKIASAKEAVKNFDLPPKAMASVVEKCLEIRTGREMGGAPSAEALLKSAHENEALRKAFGLDSSEYYKRSQKLIADKAAERINAVLSSDNDPRPIREQLKEVHDLQSGLHLDKGSVKAAALKSAVALLDQVNAADGLTVKEQESLIKAAELIKSFDLAKDKAIKAHGTALAGPLKDALNLLTQT